MLILDLIDSVTHRNKKLSDFITYIIWDSLIQWVGWLLMDGWLVGRNVEGNSLMFILFLGSQDLNKTKRKRNCGKILWVGPALTSTCQTCASPAISNILVCKTQLSLVNLEDP